MNTEYVRRAAAWIGANVLPLLLLVAFALDGGRAYGTAQGTYLPRIHFSGTFVCNAGTGNNNDVHSPYVNVNTIELAEPLKSLTTEEIRELQIRQFGTTREMDSGWNLYGDHSTYFTDAAITSVRRSNGFTTTSDPLIGRFVNIVGEAGSFPVIAMPNPQGGSSSQLFVGGVTIGTSPHPGITRLSPPSPTSFDLVLSHNTRAYSRWIARRNAAANPGEHGYTAQGCIWQFEIPPHKLDGVTAPEGSVLEELLHAGRTHDGLLVQWASYLVEPGMTNEVLFQKFDMHNYVGNPAFGELVGSILVKRTDDFATVINGRRLQPTTIPAQDCHLHQPPRDCVLPLATVTVDSANDEVTLNLISGIPEDAYAPPYQKADYGDVYLGVYRPEKELPEDAKIIGHMTRGASRQVTVPSYGYNRYMTTGGIVDFSYGDNPDIDDTLLEEGRLILFSLPSFGLLLEETPHTILTDDHVTYLEIGEHATIELRLDPPAPGPMTKLHLWEYQYTGTIPNIIRQRVGEDPDLTHKLFFQPIIHVPTGAESVSVLVIGLDHGPATLAYDIIETPLASGCDFPEATGFFSRFRVMPDDDYSQPWEVELTPEFLYQQVFRYYEVIFPAMGERIMHFKGPRIMNNGAQGVAYRVDTSDFQRPDFWFSTLYMPRTRGLSEGKEALILQWANQVQPPGPPGGNDR